MSSESFILTDEALAVRLEMVAADIRRFGRDERNVFLLEAAKRLRNPQDPDERFTKFKDRVRDMAIKEADRRGWCSEFDQIINQLGIRGRFGNYTVRYKHQVIERYTHAVTWAEASQTCIARDEQHAENLVRNHCRRAFGEIELLGVTRESDMPEYGPGILHG